MPLTDEQLLQFFRRKSGGIITDFDIEYSGDVYSLQPILFFLAYTTRAKTIVEIGTADGSTTLPLLKAADEHNGIVYSIDPSDCGACKRLVKETGYYKNWYFHQMKSDDFFKNFNEPIDFAFIDGDHSFVQVAKDIRNCCKRLSKTGIVFVSDFDIKTTTNNIPEQCDPDIYSKETFYDKQCSNGIFKGINLMMHEFPDLGTIVIDAIENPSIIIGRQFNKIKEG